MREAEQRHYTVRISVHGIQKRALKIKRDPYIVFCGQSGQSGQSSHNNFQDNSLQPDHFWKSKNLSGQSGQVVASIENGHDHSDHSEKPVQAEWSSNDGTEPQENQKDINSMTTMTTMTTYLHRSPKDFDVHAHVSETPVSCPKCFAQRIDAIGVFKLCLACGHKWQVENGSTE
jgi:hypothetical protein